MDADALIITLPDEVRNRLDALSEDTGRPVEFYVREAIAAHLGRLEWSYGGAARAEAIRSGARGTVAIDDVARRLAFDPEQLRAGVGHDD